MRPASGWNVDRTIAILRRTDEVGAQAMALRYRGVCPMCRGRVRISPENAVAGTRTFQCLECQWVATVDEVVFRGNPAVTMRGLVEAAMELHKAQAKKATDDKRNAGRRQPADLQSIRPTRPPQSD